MKSLSEHYCEKCYTGEYVSWRADLEINEAIREYLNSYIPYPNIYYDSLDKALGGWNYDVKN